MRRYQEAGSPPDGACHSPCTRSCTRWGARWTAARTSSCDRPSCGSNAPCSNRRGLPTGRARGYARWTVHAAQLGGDRTAPRGLTGASWRCSTRRWRPEPGAARAVLAAPIRANIWPPGTWSRCRLTRYLALGSPVARRLYRLLEVARAEGRLAWRVSFERLKELLPLNPALPVPPPARAAAGARPPRAKLGCCGAPRCGRSGAAGTWTTCWRAGLPCRGPGTRGSEPARERRPGSEYNTAWLPN